MSANNMIQGETREVPKRVACPQLTHEQMRDLTDICFNANNVENPDVIVVFGTNARHEELAETTIGLLERFPHAAIALTGGKPDYGDSLGIQHALLSESDVLCKILRDRADLRQRNFFIERESRNTLENILFISDFVKSIDARRLAFLSNSFSVGRSEMTIRSVLPHIDTGGMAGLHLQINGYSLTAETWHDHPSSRDIVWAEFMRIVLYSDKGDIDLGNKRQAVLNLARGLGLAARPVSLNPV